MNTVFITAFICAQGRIMHKVHREIRCHGSMRPARRVGKEHCLYEIYRRETTVPKFGREDLRIWYDGYYTAAGIRLYNPRSVVLALTDNQLRNYWTSSGPYDELFYFIRNNIEDVREELVLMVSGERVAVDIGQFAAVSMEINSREQIYSAMVVYGLLENTVVE